MTGYDSSLYGGGKEENGVPYAEVSNEAEMIDTIEYRILSASLRNPPLCSNIILVHSISLKLV